MYHNILIVCLGNICRSPTAERIMQKKLPGHQISSAGIKALAGKDADFKLLKPHSNTALSLQAIRHAS